MATGVDGDRCRYGMIRWKQKRKSGGNPKKDVCIYIYSIRIYKICINTYNP